MYNNLLYLLAVLLIIATGGTPEQPQFQGLTSLLLFGGKGLIFYQLARYYFRSRAKKGATGYLGTEQRLSILAIVFLAIDIFLLEGRFYLAGLPLARQLPTIADLGGLLIFFAYLCLIWLAGLGAYREAFARDISGPAFIKANLKINLALILPWLIISGLLDLARLAPFPELQEFIASPWGEPILTLLSLTGLIFLLPLAIIRLWGCTPLPPGPARQRIEDFCQAQRLRFADILSWPLFEGRMLTAGVMGITPRFRYLLVTPALLQATTPEELEAVMAHELGHVKRFHLQLYLFLFLGFALLAQAGSAPLLLLLLNSDYFYRLPEISGAPPDTVLTVIGSIMLFAMMLGYFRFIFGFFMRNFERQADLYALAATGQASPLVRVFEKLALLGGNIRELPSWHHFGLGQRIEFLHRCAKEPRLITSHHRKVYLALLFYTLTLLAGGHALWRISGEINGELPRARFTEALIRQKIKEQPGNGLWLQMLGDLQYSLGRERAAIAAYEQALRLAPTRPETLNNLAWLLLTAEEQTLRDPPRALRLAQKAAGARSPHILDTLATAHWANGNRPEALQIATEALNEAKVDLDYYRTQLNRFRIENYSASTGFPRQDGGQQRGTP